MLPQIPHKVAASCASHASPLFQNSLSTAKSNHYDKFSYANHPRTNPNQCTMSGENCPYNHINQLQRLYRLPSSWPAVVQCSQLKLRPSSAVPLDHLRATWRSRSFAFIQALRQYTWGLWWLWLQRSYLEKWGKGEGQAEILGLCADLFQYSLTNLSIDS